MSLLIADTTREERERIVAESIGNISEFRTAYTSGAQGPERGGCGMEELNG